MDVTGFVQDIGAGQGRRAAADDGDSLPGAPFGWSGLHIAFRESVLYYCQFVLSRIVTELSLIATTQADFGAGQMRPVNSGKLFVSCKIS